jgi:hypothetical protein
MGIMDTIRNKVTGPIQRKVVAPVQQKIKEKQSANKQAAVALRKKRSQSAPLIGKIAKQYHAGVDILENAAYVYKNVKGEDRGVHIPYGLSAADIKNKMDHAFLSESTSSKIKRGVKAVGQTIKHTKEIGEELKKTGIGRGGM